MTELFAADLQRIWWRPMTRGLAASWVPLAVAVGVIIFVHTARYPFAAGEDLRAAAAVAVIPLAFAGFVLGASALGADYTSRALTTLLTWEPRRRLVLASRACASALITAVLTLVLQLVLIVALLPSAIAHGAGGSPDASWYPSMAGMMLRCALLTAAMSVIGVAAAAIGRSTAAAVIGIVVYFFVIEYAAVQAAPSFARWLVFTDAISWVGQNSHTTIGSPVGHTVITGGLLIAGGTVAVFAVASRIFERRDVT